MGEYARAEPLYRQALEITKKAVGEGHPDYARSLSNLAALYQAMGDDAGAGELLAEVLDKRASFTRDTFAALGERQRLRFLASRAESWVPSSVCRSGPRPGPGTSTATSSAGRGRPRPDRSRTAWHATAPSSAHPDAAGRGPRPPGPPGLRHAPRGRAGGMASPVRRAARADRGPGVRPRRPERRLRPAAAGPGAGARRGGRGAARRTSRWWTSSCTPTPTRPRGARDHSAGSPAARLRPAPRPARGRRAAGGRPADRRGGGRLEARPRRSPAG
jgi:hypothetical protein